MKDDQEARVAVIQTLVKGLTIDARTNPFHLNKSIKLGKGIVSMQFF